MENKFEQMACNSQSEHQLKQYKSKQQLKQFKKKNYDKTRINSNNTSTSRENY